MPERPTGTVTFLFTDIEGSTQLWERHAAWMAAAHARHEAILRAAIAAHGGWAYKQIGDAFQAAFQTAPAALAAAVAAQQALAAEPWGEPGPLRVRMALHSGVAEERADDYVGPLLNRAARLMSAGHGGQILLTTATCELTRGHLPAGVELRDLGERWLKDLLRPEPVWQVVAEGLPDGFPPLKTLDSRPNNLPAQPNAFIGREAEVAAVGGLLRQPSVRLLTLTGPGGVGKTRLALQIAVALLDFFPDGVWFVDLAPLTNPELAPFAVAQALNINIEAGLPLVDQLAAYLRVRRLLLLLDNFEQILEAASSVDALLRAAPQVKVLVTSRAPLQLYGEREFPIQPLALPDPLHLPPLAELARCDAVRLFTERAIAVRPDFQVSGDSAATVATICVRLDGLPLAIELAAARSKILPPQALLARLTEGLQALSGGPRSQTQRRRSLRATIDWSYDLLTAQEQALFRRLAVFRGSAGVEAAAAVCLAPGGTPVDVLDALTSLVDKSLLQTREGLGQEPRFVMLETIHAYAREALEAQGEQEATARRHALYFMSVAEAAEPHLMGARQVEWLDRLQEEQSNLLEALTWATASDSDGSPAGCEDPPAASVALRIVAGMWRFWKHRGNLGEGRAHLDAALQATATAVALTKTRADALYGAGQLAELARDLGAARALREESLRLYRACNDRQGVATAHNDLGDLLLAEGRLAEARRYYAEALALRRELGDLSGTSISLNDLGNVASAQGDFTTARSFHEESLAIRRAIGWKGGIAVSLMNLAQVAYYQGDYNALAPLHEECLVLWRELGDRRRIAEIRQREGHLAVEQGDFPRARTLLEESVAVWEELGEPSGLACALHLLGTLSRDTGDLAKAWPLYRESLGMIWPLRNWPIIAEALEMLGGFVAAAAEHSGAPADGLLRAARIWGATAALREEAGVRCPAGEIARHERELAAARARVDPVAWDRAWAEGLAMPAEEAVAYALEEEPDA